VPVIWASDKTSLTNLWVTSISGHCHSQSVVLEKKSAAHLQGETGLLLGWSSVSRKVPKILTRRFILRFKQRSSHSRILTSLALDCTGIVLRNSRNNVNLFWMRGSAIIQNKSWLLKSHMAHAWCVKFLKVQEWGIQVSTTWYPKRVACSLRAAGWNH
jgi:hypothetical protein